MAAITECYDLAVSPPTHDFLNWLLRAEHVRREQGADALNVRLVPGHRLTSDRDKQYSPDRRNWRVMDLLPQLARLLPSVADVSMGPGEQTLAYANPGQVVAPILSAPPLAKQIVAGLGLKNIVTFTLRQSEFEASRNSNKAELEKVASWVESKGFTPVFIPDAEADMRGQHQPGPFIEYVAASYNFALRLALWESAKLNIFNNGGPLVMALYSDVPMLCFKMYVPDVLSCQKEHLIRSAFSPEHDWSTARNRKRLFWEPDTAKNIIPVLDNYLAGK